MANHYKQQQQYLRISPGACLHESLNQLNQLISIPALTGLTKIELQ